MVEILQAIIDGAAVGGVLSLASIGLTLIYSILRLCSFAHGDMVTLGAYITLSANVGLGLDMVSASALGTVGAVIFALVCDRLLWLPLRRQRANDTTLMITSIGLAYVIRNGIILIWGASPQRYNLPTFPPIPLGELLITRNKLLVIGASIGAIIVVGLILQKTKIGKAMRAVADSPELAKIAGINVKATIIGTWILSTVLTALGGTMYGLIANLRPNMGWLLLLPMFTAVIMGGIGNVYGAVLGALIVGLAQEVGTVCPQFLGANAQYCIPTDYKLGIGLLIMILVLLLRPQGLLNPRPRS
jgi:neutral amino acid transport system permease protein